MEGRRKDLIIVNGRNIYPQVVGRLVSCVFRPFSTQLHMPGATCEAKASFIFSSQRVEKGACQRFSVWGCSELTTSPARPRVVLLQDVEFAAQDASTLVRPGCVAAFSETELGGSLQASTRWRP